MIGEDVSVKQSEVGKRFGVGQSAVTKWKTGKDTPSLPRAVEMASDHGVCVEWLLTGRGPKYPGGTTDAELSRLLEFWKELPDPTKRDVVSYAVFKAMEPANPRAKDSHEKPEPAHKKTSHKLINAPSSR